MAAKGLDHLKNVYRRRFCRPSRVPDINKNQDQNILEILQDCFEEKSLSDDFSTNSTKSVLCSTPKLKDISIQSPRKECQKSLPESVLVSSRKKEACLPFIVEPSEAANISVQAHEVHEKILATDAGSKNTPDMKNVSRRKLNDHHSEADGEFYLSVGSPVILDAKTSFSQNAIPSIAQKRETYTSEKSVNMLSSSMEISLKTKKRLNFDKDNLKNVEITEKVSQIEDKVSEGPQKMKPSGTFQKRTRDMEYEIQPQAKKSFSTLFLETVKRKSESGSVVRHIATAPPHSSSPNDVKLLEDEFIIDESDRGFSNQSWIIIPRKTGLPKQCTRSVENTVLLEGKKLGEKHHDITSETSTNGKQSHKAQSIQKSKPPEQKELGRNCASTDEMENNYRSTEYVLYSHDAEKSSGNKRTAKQKQKRKFKANVIEEQLDIEHSKDKNINMSHIAQDKFERNSDRNVEKCEEMRNDRVSSKEMLPMGKKKSSTKISHKEHQKKDKEESKNKRFSNGLRNKLVPDKVTETVTRSRRISRHPSNWWMVKSEQSPVYSNSSSIRNELSVHHNSRQKSAGKTNQSSKNIGEKTIPLRRQKTATQGSSRQQKFLNAKDSKGIIGCDEISSYSQNKSLESDKKDLAKKKNLDHSRAAGSLQDQDSSATVRNVHQKSQISGYKCKTPVESNLDSREPKTSILDESGPSRLQNYLASGKNNSDVDEKEVQENSDDSRVKSFKVTENKIHHKLVLPSNTPNVRRTKRTRLKPLEYWRGERVDYEGRPSGGFVIGGVLSPDTMSSKRKAKGNMGKVNKIANRKRICLDDDERKNKLVTNLNMALGDPLRPTRVKDPDTREIILMDLIRPRNTYQFFVEHNELKVYKTLDTSYFSTGKLILGPCQEKGKQHVGPDTLVFYVNFGDLLCTLHETPYIMSTGDSFYVPSGNYYNIKNLLNEESVLLFTQIKR